MIHTLYMYNLMPLQTICTTITLTSLRHFMPSLALCMHVKKDKVFSLLSAKVLEEMCNSSLCVALTFTLPIQLKADTESESQVMSSIET